MKTHIAAILFVLSWSTPIFALGQEPDQLAPTRVGEQTRIEITVTTSGKAVSNAQIVISNLDEETSNIVGRTNPSGKYSESLLMPGKYKILVHNRGYDSTSRVVKLQAGVTNTFNFSIKKRR